MVIMKLKNLSGSQVNFERCKEYPCNHYNSVGVLRGLKTQAATVHLKMGTIQEKKKKGLN